MSPPPTVGIPRLPPSAIARRDALAAARIAGREAAMARDARILEAEGRLAAANDPPGTDGSAVQPTARSPTQARNTRMREAEARLSAVVAATATPDDNAFAGVCAMLRQALIALGGPAYLIRQGEENPRTFLTLLGKLIPDELRAAAQRADGSGDIVVVTGVPDADDYADGSED